MTSDITITHQLTGKGTGHLTAGQQQQLAALVPAEATTKLRTEDGGVLTAAKWTWTATWSADVDKEWRDEPRNAYYADQREGHADFCTVEHLPGVSPCRRIVPAPQQNADPRPEPRAFAGDGSLPDQERFAEWAARQLDTTYPDIKIHFYVVAEDNQFALVARAAADACDGSPGHDLWEAARGGDVTSDLLAKRHHKPATTPTMADGKTPRCQSVSDGTHGYAAGSQCGRIDGHDPLRNIVGHTYRRQPKDS